MKKQIGILFCAVSLFLIFCSVSFATPLSSSSYSVIDTWENEVWTSGSSGYFYDANRNVLPSGVHELFNHSVNEAYDGIRIESESGAIGEKVLVGFTFNLDTTFNNSINEGAKDDFEFGFFENGFDFGFFISGEAGYTTQTVNPIINNSDPWSSSTTTTSFTLYSELDTYTDYETHYYLSEYFNADNPVYSGPLNDEDFINEFGFWNELYIRGWAELTDISVVTPVPEPATLLLFSFGLVGVAGATRRKRKK